MCFLVVSVNQMGVPSSSSLSASAIRLFFSVLLSDSFSDTEICFRSAFEAFKVWARVSFVLQVWGRCAYLFLVELIRRTVFHLGGQSCWWRHSSGMYKEIKNPAMINHTGRWVRQLSSTGCNRGFRAAIVPPCRISSLSSRIFWLWSAIERRLAFPALPFRASHFRVKEK